MTAQQEDLAEESTYPDQAEIIQLTEHNLLDWVDTSFLRHDPFIFRGHDFRELSRLTARLLDVDPNGIYCVGSGAIGLSMSPKKVQDDRTLKPFGDDSDLDLAVISSHYFDIAWRDLRLAAQPILSNLNGVEKDLISWQRKRLFQGAIIADKAMPMLSFADPWTRGIGQLSEKIALTLGHNIDVHVWIYRDYWSVRNYVAEGITACQKELA